MTSKIIYFMILCFFLFILPCHCEDIVSEVLNIKSGSGLLFIEVAKKYPQIKFSQYDNPPKILIELLDTNYHNNFKFDIPIKNNILGGLDFVSDVTVGVSRYENDKYKVAVVLSLKDNTTLAPKLVSTKENLISIAFLKREIVQEVPKAKVLLDIPDIKEIYNSAVDEHVKGNLDNALSLYEKVIIRDPGFYLAKFNLAKVLIDKQRYDEALNILQKDPFTGKNLIFVDNILGNIFYLKGELPKAEEYFQEVVKLDPSFADGYYNLGLVLEQDKKISEATQNFQKVIELKSDSLLADAYYHLGVLSLIQKDKKEAITKFEKALELAGDSVVAELSKNELAKLKKPQKHGKRGQDLLK